MLGPPVWLENCLILYALTVFLCAIVSNKRGRLSYDASYVPNLLSNTLCLARLGPPCLSIADAEMIFALNMPYYHFRLEVHLLHYHPIYFITYEISCQVPMDILHTFQNTRMLHNNRNLPVQLECPLVGMNSPWAAFLHTYHIVHCCLI